MTITVSRLVSGAVLTTSAAIYYTCPASTGAVLKRSVFSNTTASSVKITAYVVPAGGSPGAANQVITTLPVAAGITYPSPELAGMTLGPGDTLQALCDTAASITLVSSGITVV